MSAGRFPPSATGGESLTDSAHPLGPYFVALFAGVLILSNGILVWLAGAVAFASWADSSWASLETVGYFGMFLGFVIILLATFLFIDPKHPFGYGVAVIALSLVSFFTGGGFLLGMILGLLGGIWMLWIPPSEAEVGPNVSGGSSGPRIPDQRCGVCGKSFSGSARACPFCGTRSLASLGTP